MAGAWATGAYPVKSVFQHTATRRWLVTWPPSCPPTRWFQHTATRRWLAIANQLRRTIEAVSTHSHPKVAGSHPRPLVRKYRFQHTATRRWLVMPVYSQQQQQWFQHTATRRWLGIPNVTAKACPVVSTHSHPKVAGYRPDLTILDDIEFQHTATRRWLGLNLIDWCGRIISFNTQPPEGGWGSVLSAHVSAVSVSTHSHPKVAGDTVDTFGGGSLFQHTATRRWLAGGFRPAAPCTGRFNTQPPEGGWAIFGAARAAERVFQHTATRRWLVLRRVGLRVALRVSTHSHPKVAGRHDCRHQLLAERFNTQPPEGGWNPK